MRKAERKRGKQYIAMVEERKRKGRYETEREENRT
jgi:hypothetical protein